MEDSIVLLYCGDFNDHVLINSTEIFENYISGGYAPEKYKTKMFFLMTEAFQNVIRYAEKRTPKHKNLNDNMFITRERHGNVCIATTNLIDNKRVDAVSEKIKNVNQLNNEELKRLFFSIISNSTFSTEGGAGLGFIEMSRKSRTDLQYDFTKIDDKLSFFYFLTHLLTNKEHVKDVNIEDLKAMHKKISDANILLMLKNEFSDIMVNSLLQMVEDNIINIDNVRHKLAYHMIVELVQNLSKHVATMSNKQAIITMSQQGKDLTITTINFIKNSNLENLKSRLTKLKKMSKAELSMLYISLLTNVYSDAIGGIGFIDIARESKDFNFKFINSDENLSFFLFSLTIQIYE